MSKFATKSPIFESCRSHTCLFLSSILQRNRNSVQTDTISSDYWDKFKGSIPQRLQYFGTHEGFRGQIFLFLVQLALPFGISGKKGGVFVFSLIIPKQWVFTKHFLSTASDSCEIKMQYPLTRFMCFLREQGLQKSLDTLRLLVE